MASRTLPNLALKGFWNLGEDLWKTENDLNLLKLSALTQAGAISKVAATPGAPAAGDVHIFDETHPTQANKIAIYDDGAWVYVTPLEGWLVYNRADGYFEKFDGTVWAELATGGAAAINDLTDVDTATAAPTVGDVLVWDGTNWVPDAPTVGGAVDIDDLSDVDTTTAAPTVGDVLTWDGTNWVPDAPSGGGGSGLPELLDYAYATAATAATAMGSGTLVPGMSLSFTLAGTRDIHVIFSALLQRASGQARMQVKVNGTSYNPASHTQPFYSVETEGGGRYTNGSYILSLGSGSHTIELWAEDAQTVVNTTWFERYIKAEALS